MLLTEFQTFTISGLEDTALFHEFGTFLPDGGLPDVGAYLAMLKVTTGVDPVHITGKPNAGMILHKIEALGLDPAKCAMVGDRLYTDIAMATRAGCVGVLVLSGEATMSDVESLPTGAEQHPTVIVGSVDNLLR